MSEQSDVFANPNNLPVEKLTLSVTNAGVVQQIKALDPYWVDKARKMKMYEHPPSGSELVMGAVDAWRIRMEAYHEDLKWLLGLEHHKFWSTVLYHSQCMDSLVSFLQEATPPYVPPHESKEVQALYVEIRRLVLVAFSRLITNKESKSHWMSKEYMSGLIYDNFIFTVPILWDICLTYGVDNRQHVARLVSSVYAVQPKYEADTAAAVRFVNESFKYIILQVNKDYESAEPPNLPETFKGFSDIRRPGKTMDKLTFDVLKDIVIHLLDTTMTLRIFTEVYPKCVAVLRKSNFVNSIVQLYEHGIPLLYEKLSEVGDPTSVQCIEVEDYLDSARVELIDVFKEILAVYKNAIFSGDGNIASHVEDYLTVLLDGLAERLFILDYHACYPVHDDLEMLRQAYPQIDTVKTDFILQAIYSTLDDPTEEVVLTNGHAESIDNEPGPSTDNVQTTTDTEIPDNVKEQSLITEVKDILPHLGDGFILKCLQHYGFSAERVINSILEDNLAESLKGLDQNLPIIPEDILDKKFLETGIQRLNVFDGDEFDIMTRDDVDVSKIHVGKKRSKYKDLKDMLNDKTEVKQLGDIYSKYNLVCDEEDMYSDEYDDTYDTDGGAAPTGDAGADDPRRPVVTPRVLQTHRREAEESSESEAEEEKPASSANRNRMDFCVNPEEIRARREANFARRGRGRPVAPQQSKPVDVVGKPKGQGQEKDVLHNREKKEKHKSSRANHNRRQGAQWKRSQGMMPS